MNYFSWPKFDESSWNYHMIPVHSRAVSDLPSGAKKNGEKIRLQLRLPVLLGIRLRLHPKTSDSLRLRLRNPASQPQKFACSKIVSDYFAVFPIILPLIWPLFCLSWENKHKSLTRECSCILCPNVENFCPNNGQFFSFGDATASAASPCRMLMPSLTPPLWPDTSLTRKKVWV